MIRITVTSSLHIARTNTLCQYGRMQYKMHDIELGQRVNTRDSRLGRKSHR
jgi:hypothetical protein